MTELTDREKVLVEIIFNLIKAMNIFKNLTANVISAFAWTDGALNSFNFDEEFTKNVEILNKDFGCDLKFTSKEELEAKKAEEKAE